MSFGDVNVTDVLIQYVCLLLSLCVHEASHAGVADRCGDPSARLLGRLSLNPLAHIDPIGTVVMPLVMMTTGIPYLIGWAKPVPINPRNLNNIRRDQVLVAIAGPTSNLLLALGSAVALRVAVIFFGLHVLASPLSTILVVFMMTNLVLAIFNLIPVPPLDGSWLLHYFLPPSGQQLMERMGPFGILIVLFAGQSLLAGPVYYLREVLVYFIVGGA